MQPETRWTVVNAAMLAAAVAVVAAIMFMRPAERMARHGAEAQSAALAADMVAPTEK